MPFEGGQGYAGSGAGPFAGVGYNNTFASNYMLLQVMYTTTGPTVSGCTYNGVAMTKLSGATSPGGGQKAEIWGLDTPASGSHDIGVTVSGSITSILFVVSTWSGFSHGAGSVRGQATGSNTTANPSVSITSSLGDLIIDAVSSINALSYPGTGSVTGNDGIHASAVANATSPTSTMAWTAGGSNNWAMAVVALIPLQTVSPSAIGSGEAIGTAQVNRNVLPPSIASLEALGAATVLPGAVTVAPSGIASAEAFGVARIIQTIVASAIASGEVVPSPTVTSRAYILPSGIASLEAFGVLNLLFNQTVVASGIVSAEAFGSARIVLYIKPTGIPSGEVVPVPNVIQIVFDQGRIAAIILDANDVPLGSGPILNLIKASFVDSLDKIGTWEIQLPALDERAGMFDQAGINLLPNGGFEVDLAGWSPGGTNTLVRDLTAAKFGVASAKGTYLGGGDTNVGAQFYSVPVPGLYTLSAWMLIASAFGGGAPTLGAEIYTTSGGSLQASADLGIRDAWQRVSCTFVPIAGGLNGAAVVRIPAAASGQFLRFDGVVIERGGQATPNTAAQTVVLFREGEGEIWRGKMGRSSIEAQE